jgi:hypothetical protein
MSNSVDSDQPCFTKVHNWLARLRFRDRARPEPKWPLVTRLLGEPLVGVLLAPMESAQETEIYVRYP